MGSARKLSSEHVASALLIVVLAYAIILGVLDPVLFRLQFEQDDQFIEYATFFVLLFISILCLRRAFALFGLRGLTFTAFSVCYGMLFFVGAAEEISWGQRLLNIETPGWFVENNRQQEINFHNLTTDSFNIIDLLTITLPALLLVYSIVIPALYRRNVLARHILDSWAVPIAKPYVIALLLVSVLISKIVIHYWFSPKAGDELFEFAVVYCIAVIGLFPENKEIFRTIKQERAG